MSGTTATAAGFPPVQRRSTGPAAAGSLHVARLWLSVAGGREPVSANSSNSPGLMLIVGPSSRRIREGIAAAGRSSAAGDHLIGGRGSCCRPAAHRLTFAVDDQPGEPVGHSMELVEGGAATLNGSPPDVEMKPLRGGRAPSQAVATSPGRWVHPGAQPGAWRVGHDTGRHQ